MLAEGIATRRGRSGAYLHRDEVNGVVSGPARGAARRDHVAAARSPTTRGLLGRRGAGRHDCWHAR